MKYLLAVDDDLRYEDVLASLDWCLAPLGESDEAIVAHAVAPLRWMPLRSESDPGWAGTERAIFERVDAFLAETVGRLEDKGFPARSLRLEGDVAAELSRAASEEGADAIVMGAIGQARGQDFLVGSVAEKMTSQATKDILLVRGKGPADPPDFRALVAVDGPDAGADVILSFATRTRSDRAAVRLVHVMEVPPPRWDVEVGGRGDPGVPPLLRNLSEETLARAGELFDHYGLKAETRLRRGSPALEILDAAEEFDAHLIVLAIRGGTAPHRSVGTVARRVARHAPGSVLLVQRASEERKT